MLGRAGRPDAGLLPGRRALVGVVLLHRGGQRPAARLFGLGDRRLAAAGGGGRRLGAAGAGRRERLFAPALLFAAVPAAHALAQVLRPVRRWGGWGSACLPARGAGPVVTLALPSHRDAWLGRWREQRAACRSASAPTARTWSAVLKENTTTEARILWEDRRGPPRSALDGPAAPADRPRLRRRTRPRRRHRTHGRRPDRPDAGRPAARRLDRRRTGRLLRPLQHRLGGVLVRRRRRSGSTLPALGGGGTTAPVELRDGGPADCSRCDREPTFALHGAGPLAVGRLQPHRADGREAGRRITSCSACTTRRGCAFAEPHPDRADRTRATPSRSCGCCWTSRRRW